MPAVQALICDSYTGLRFSLFPFVTTTGRNLFGERILVSYKSSTYNFTITNLQFNDTGPYFLLVAVSTTGSNNITIKSSTIKICNIRGKFYFLSLFVFPLSVYFDEITNNLN